jgi:hypothetical protein
MCAPLGIVWLVTALIMAIFGRKKGEKEPQKQVQKEKKTIKEFTTNSLNYIGGTAAIIITIIISLVQLVAIAGGFIEWTGSVFWGILLSIVLDFIPVIGTIAGIYYATTIWGWNVLLAITFFCFPLVVQLLTGSFALILMIPVTIWEYVKKLFK